MPSNKDRELQIILAKLQVEAQFYTSAAFGLAAIVVSVLVLLETLYFTLPPEQAIVKNLLPYSIGALAGALVLAITVLLYRIRQVETEIEALKGTYAKDDRKRG